MAVIRGGSQGPILLHVAVTLIICAAIALTYGQVRHHEFIRYEDSQGLIGGFFQTGAVVFNTGKLTPIATLSHAIDIQLFGMNAGAHHLVNVFFHILTTLLIYSVFFITTREVWKCCFVAVMFAIHPLHAESVGWVAQRGMVLGAFFWMLTMVAYVRYVKCPRICGYLPVIICFGLGLMTDPLVVALPLILILMDAWPLRRIGFSPESKVGKASDSHDTLFSIIEKIPLITLSTVIGILTVLYGGGGMDAQHLSNRLVQTPIAYAATLLKIIAPLNLYAGFPYQDAVSIWKNVGATAMLAVVSLLALRRSRTRPYIMVGWLWYLVTMTLPGRPFLAYRSTCMPLIGIFIMVAWGGPNLLKEGKIKKPAMAVMTVAFSLLFMTLSWFQIRHWSDNYSLYSHAVKVSENNYVAHNNLGAALFRDGQTYKSIWHFMRALEIKPDDDRGLANLQKALLSNQNIDQAIESVKRYLSLYPQNSSLYHTLGVLYVEKGSLEEACNSFKHALALYPPFAQATMQLRAIPCR